MFSIKSRLKKVLFYNNKPFDIKRVKYNSENNFFLQLSRALNVVWHGKIANSVLPSLEHDHVQSDQVVARIQSGAEALVPSLLQEPIEQLLGQLGVT